MLTISDIIKVVAPVIGRMPDDLHKITLGQSHKS
jgi:hypothetical protein